MLTGEIKSKIDKIWETLWSGGISNPLSVIEQLTFLLFIKGLDEQHTLAENKANRLKKPIENPIFTEQQDSLRWSRFKDFAPDVMYKTLRDEVFPFIKNMDKDSSFNRFMEDAQFIIPKASLLASIVDQLDGIEMVDRDTKGDLYEYMLSKLATSGQNGQFRTPRHIIKLMVDLMQPKPADTICDPACGTAGFLVVATEYLQQHYQSEIYKDEASRKKFNEETLFGYDFDSTMLRIASMNLKLHGVDNPDIRYRDSLAENETDDKEKYSLVLANPPFKGSLDYEGTAKDLLQTVKTKKTELLFMALFLRQLQIGGRAAVIVPDGVLFGSSKAHKTIRKMLVEDNKLDGVISMPSGVFKPYAGVSTAILLFTKVGVEGKGGTDKVWFYDMKADGFSLDDKRTPQENSDLPDILARWQSLSTDRSIEESRAKTEQSFMVDKADIASNDYDLSINRYKEVVYEQVQYEEPAKILENLTALNQKISEGQEELKGLIG